MCITIPALFHFLANAPYILGHVEFFMCTSMVNIIKMTCAYKQNDNHQNDMHLLTRHYSNIINVASYNL